MSDWQEEPLPDLPADWAGRSQGHAAYRGLSGNALLAHIRRMILVFYAKGELDDDETAELVGYVDQLDEHLTAGSEIPLEWRPVVTRRTVDLPPL